MSAKQPIEICDSCGLPLSEKFLLKEDKFNICYQCTLNGTEEPDFEINVYNIAVGYFMNRQNVQDPSEALYKAHMFVSDRPYWKNKPRKTISIEGLNFVRLLLVKSLEDRINQEENVFYISYHRETNQPLIDSLATSLEDYEYQVWVANDTKDEITTKSTEEIIDRIKSTNFSILILSKAYLMDKRCQEELETLIRIQTPNKLFPVWGKDVDAKFLEQQGKKNILGIMGTVWTDWQGDTEILANKLVQRAQYAQGIQPYGSVPLVAVETQVLKDLEKLVGRTIPAMSAESLQSAQLGFYAEKNRIKNLKMSNCQLNYLPESLRQCLELKTLNLTNNDLMKLPLSFEKLKNLHTLEIRGNRFQALPASFRTTHKHLLPSYPGLVTEEAEVLALLELLLGKVVPLLAKIEWNSFGYIVEGGHVIGLGIHKQDLKVLPEIIGDLSQLVELHLSYNQLVSLPKRLFELTNLQKLSLSSNNLTSVSNSIGQLNQLKYLSLTSNKLEILPETIDGLTNLQELFLSDNKLVSLPDSIEKLTNLTCLGVNGNQLISLPEGVGKLRNLQALYLIGNRLTSLPESLGNMTELQVLSLMDNKLTSLPENIGQLANLKELLLERNKLTAVPESIGKLARLKELRLYENSLKDLPASIENLKSLKILSLHNKFLKALPSVEKLKEAGCEIH